MLESEMSELNKPGKKLKDARLSVIAKPFDECPEGFTIVPVKLNCTKSNSFAEYYATLSIFS